MRPRKYPWARASAPVGVLLIVPAFFAWTPRLQAADGVETDHFVGSTAAGWRLEALDGRPYRLADFAGQAVVLNFWATWCAPCRLETKWLIQLHAKYRGRGLQILGISMDAAADDSEVARFAATYAVDYPLLLRGESIADLYGGVRYLPQTFFIDRRGRIVRHTRGMRDIATLEADVARILR